MDPITRNNVVTSGAGSRFMLFAHGFGCDQTMWRHVAPKFEEDFRVVTLDYVGAGGSDKSAYDAQKYSTLDGYADDVVEVAKAVGIRDGVFVGHSVSAMIGALASLKAPGLFSELIMVGPSPRYTNDGDYHGGFEEDDIADLLSSLEANPMAWSEAMAPAIMGVPERPELGQELNESFCRLDPKIAVDFGRATFMADNRDDLSRIEARTLVLQCQEDIIASEKVGKYVRDRIPDATMTILDATGHCPHLSAPDEVIASMRAFL